MFRRGAHRDEGGFTLVELVVGMTLMMTVTLGLARVTDSGLKGTQEINDRGVLTSVATAEIEAVRVAAFDSLVAPSTTTRNVDATDEVPIAHAVTRTISWKTGSTTVKDIDVEVTWKEGDSPRHVSLSTLRYPGGSGPAVANVGPTAAFTTDRSTGSAPLTVTFDGSSSSDSDGSIVRWEWTFGDGTSATGAAVSKTYSANGGYSAVLKVTDDDGATAVTSRVITVAPNSAPNAVLVASQTSGHGPLSVTFTGTGSTDPEGGALSYTWAFGDGTTGSGSSVAKTYSTYGTFTAVLTVTDPGGLTDAASTTITVTTNRAPFAIFAVVENSLTVTVDGGSSTDADGDPLTYSWDWGDGTADATGVTASHTYAALGNHTITLSVNDGLADATTTNKPCLISAASFRNPASNATANYIDLKGNKQAQSSSFTFYATSNQQCATMALALPYRTGTYSTTLNLISGTTTKNWSRTVTLGSSYTWDAYPGTTYTATMSSTGGSVLTYLFAGQ
jgi:PKD repeat protein